MTQSEWKTETTRLIIEAINTLPESERQAFICKHYKGMKVSEIAANLQRSVEDTAELLKLAERRLSDRLNHLRREAYRASLAFC